MAWHMQPPAPRQVAAGKLFAFSRTRREATERLPRQLFPLFIVFISGGCAMRRRQQQNRSFSIAAEVLELRSLLSGLSVAGHAGAIAQHFHAAALHPSSFAVAHHDILSHLSTTTPVS